MLRLEDREPKRDIFLLKWSSVCPQGLKKRSGWIITVPKSPHRSRGLLGCLKKRETLRCFCSGVIMTGNLKSAKSYIDGVVWNIRD